MAYAKQPILDPRPPLVKAKDPANHRAKTITVRTRQRAA